MSFFAASTNWTCRSTSRTRSCVMRSWWPFANALRDSDSPENPFQIQHSSSRLFSLHNHLFFALFPQTNRFTPTKTLNSVYSKISLLFFFIFSQSIFYVLYSNLIYLEDLKITKILFLVVKTLLIFRNLPPQIFGFYS